MKTFLKNTIKNNFNYINHLKNSLSNEFFVTILLYHRISLNNNNSFLGNVISQEIFRKQLLKINKDYSIISMNELNNQLKTNKYKKKKQIVITFDDGYSDNYKIAYPLLKELGIPATFFIPTSYISSNNLLWDCRLQNIFQNNKNICKKIINGRNHNLSLIAKKFENNLIWYFINLLKIQDFENISKYLDNLISNYDLIDNSYDEDLCMTWENINAMLGENIEFGSHGRQHLSLANRNKTFLYDEIIVSKNDIINNTKSKCNYFSFPFGSIKDFDKFSLNFIRSNNYDLVFSNIQGTNKSLFNNITFNRRIMSDYTNLNTLFA